jgi:hypothetical protein
MPRLPKPGQDAGQWGDILNDYLSVTHKSDGTFKPNIVTSDTIAPGAITRETLSQSVKDQLQASIAQGATGPAGASGLQGATGATGVPGTTAWAGITDRPGTFAPDIHTHTAADIASGMLAADRIPAGSTLTVRYDAGVWPARPTARTDILVQWLNITGDAPVPPGAIVGDLVIKDVA